LETIAKKKGSHLTALKEFFENRNQSQGTRPPTADFFQSVQVFTESGFGAELNWWGPRRVPSREW
jgi:hypothetical protein